MGAPTTALPPPSIKKRAAAPRRWRSREDADGSCVSGIAHAARDGAAVTVTVTDQGPGISANNRDKVFERFFTTRRDRGGTGLGLPIVRAIARARGGDAWLAHSGAEGTAFALRLPVAHDPAVSAPA